uniref:Protein kinase domain-containing protein n=1 Tax=Heterorhabditis bacteriophora TaxID=37862 RepID=A0A1I7XKH6_HETBA
MLWNKIRLSSTNPFRSGIKYSTSLSSFYTSLIRTLDPLIMQLYQLAERDEGDRPVILLREILEILVQVANALRHIHETTDQFGQEYTHGDVAARNVLLTSRDLRRCTAKLGDFGLPANFGPLPIPWLPPEIVCAMEKNPRHRSESDVWMFGVLSWECLTLGAEPHYQRTLSDIQRCFRLPDRGLTCPHSCPLDVLVNKYAIYLGLWSWNACPKPTAAPVLLVPLTHHRPF